MDFEAISIIIAVVLPLYPSLFVIYQKIGKYDVMCEDFRALREEHDLVMKGKESHGPSTGSNQ